MTADNPISALLSAPLRPDWTVDRLAEEVLCAIAAQEAQEFTLDAGAAIDLQSRRLLRPLLACLATKSATEAGMPPDPYGGCLSFQRPGHTGPVWIVGQFENTPGTVRVTLRRSSLPPRECEPPNGEPALSSDGFEADLREGDRSVIGS